MACFLATTACRGSIPKNINLKGKHNREHLISKLMSQRNVLRFVNAPDGFGKTTLVAQYAELVFSFKNVFWINCKSPCFLRDLDSENIFEQLIDLNDNIKLVVFDDLDDFSDDRKEKFSKLIDGLLDFGAEVIATSAIYNDNLIKYQQDSLILKSEDLLLINSEIAKSCDNNLNERDEINRIPIIAWSENGLHNLLTCACKQSSTDAILFSLFYIYLFENGNLGDLGVYIPKSSLKLLKEINREYIYFGINEETQTFTVPEISVRDLLNIFSSNRPLIFRHFEVPDKNAFVTYVYDKLIENKKYIKALELVRCWASKGKKIACLEQFNEKSIRNMYMLYTSLLFESFSFAKKDSGLNSVFHALRLAIFGLKSDAIRLSYSVLDNSISSIDNKLFAALIFMRFGDADEKAQAVKIIRYLNNDFKVENYLKNKTLDENEKFKCRMIKKVAQIYLAIYSQNLNPFESWLNFCDDELSNEDIIAAECILNSSSSIRTEHIKSRKFKEFISVISRHFNYGSKVEFNFYTFALIKSYIKCRNDLEDYVGNISWDINNDLLVDLDNYEHKLNLEKNNFSKVHKCNFGLYENINLDNLKNSSRVIQSYKNILSSSPYIDIAVPKLFIKVFGGLTAYLDGQEILDTNFRRQNIKLLCCILAIENGQEISKDKVASIIWPESDSEQQRININTHWSVIKRLFTLPDNSCPYFVRSQNSYKLSTKFCDSDLFIFENFVSDLTMGPLDSQSWFEMISKNQNVINGDLLPSETENVYIKNKRIEYKNMLVNALIAASERLLEAGEIQQSLWFANKAISRDATREDVYAILMKAQMKAGQRTPAIETYLACKKFLEDDMGIKPSSEIRKMYDHVKTEISL